MKENGAYIANMFTGIQCLTIFENSDALFDSIIQKVTPNKESENIKKEINKTRKLWAEFYKIYLKLKCGLSKKDSNEIKFLTITKQWHHQFFELYHATHETA